MNRNLFAVGIVILVIGLFLSLAFWPLFGTSAESLADDRTGLVYESYEEGDKVTVYGTITNIETTNYPEWMEEIGISNVVYVELDDGFTFLIPDQTSTDFSEGDSIYARTTLEEEGFILGWGRVQYWEQSGMIGNKLLLDVIFYITLALGVIITVAGTVKI
ncbi:MAG: hypothetical protein R6U17_09185 [Thermoplasmata archaeon]